MKKRVAIFPAGSEVGLEILRALKYSSHFEVYGFSSVKDHGEFVFSNYVEGIPFYTAPNFIDVLNEMLERYQIDYLYPALDDLVLFLTGHEEEIHAKVVTYDKETIRICRSKTATYEYLKGLDFVPKTYASIEEIDRYPVFIKPDVGQGSQGAKLIFSRKEMEQVIKENPKIVICEYLSGEEYTIDCFTNANKELLVMKLRNRNRIRTGISVNSKILPLDNRVVEIANLLNQRFHMNGAWFFQLKRTEEGDYKLLEVATRIAGTMGLTRNTGINLPMLTLFNLEGKEIKVIQNDYQMRWKHYLNGGKINGG